MKKNIYNFDQRDIDGNFQYTEILNVTNTYPVFLKIDKENNNKNGKDRQVIFPVTFEPRRLIEGKMEPYKDYSSRAQMSIIRYMKEKYEKLSHTNAHESIEQFEKFAIEKITDNDLILLFIRSQEDLILLNYFGCNDRLEYLPSNMRNNNRHVYFFTHNTSYCAINTYVPFLQYGEENGLYPKLDLNIPFFQSFKAAFKKSMNRKVGINICINNEMGEQFEYYMFRENIIITGYTKL